MVTLHENCTQTGELYEHSYVPKILSVAQATALLGSWNDHWLPKYQLANPYFLQ